ncbi:MAG: HEAT repeat domain-containing protein [bacterium]|nr:HEAT repeat domain-containing protein [bacterium]
MIKKHLFLILIMLVSLFFIGCPEQESITQLLADLQSPPEEITIKILAAQKLKELKDPTAVPYLIAALADGNPQVRQNVADVLVIYGTELPEETIPQLKDNLASNSDLIRTEIMNILARIGKPAIPALRKALKSNNSFVRLNSIKILGEIGDKSVIYDLIQVLEETKSEEIQVLCAISLAKLKSPAAIESLQKLLNESKSDDVKIQAIRAIGDLDSKDSAILLIKQLNDKQVNPGVKVVAIESLEKMKIDSADLKKSLMQLVSSDNDKLRMEAIYLLYKLGDNRGMKFVREDVDEKYEALSQLAIITLGRTGDTSKETIASLNKALGFENETLRILAAKSLILCGDQKGKEVLLECLRSCQNEGNKLITIDYIAELKIKEGSSILMEILRSANDFAMINSILNAIKELDMKESIPELKEKYLRLATQPELKIVIIEILNKFHTAESKKVFEELLKYEEDKDRYFHYEINKIIQGW